jgi:hypothetical protein
MDAGSTLLLIFLIGALYFGVMAHVAKFSWYDIKRTTQFTSIAIAFTIAFMISAWVML